MFSLSSGVSSVRGLTGCSCEVSPRGSGGSGGAGGSGGDNPPPPPPGGPPGGCNPHPPPLPPGGGGGGHGPGGGAGGPPAPGGGGPGALAAVPQAGSAGPAPRPVLMADPDPLTRDRIAERNRTVNHLDWPMSHKMIRYINVAHLKQSITTHSCSGTLYRVALPAWTAAFPLIEYLHQLSSRQFTVAHQRTGAALLVRGLSLVVTGPRSSSSAV